MNFFPIALNLTNKKILIVGAGKVAFVKVNKLLDFTNNITVISKDINEKIKSLDVQKIEKEYEKGDIKGFDIVIVCTNNIKIQEEIYNESRDEKVLFSCADILELCDFTFSSILKKDDLLISISTSGTSPSFGKELKNYLDKIIPNSVGEFLKEMKYYRETLPKGVDRMELLRKKSIEFLKGWKDEK